MTINSTSVRSVAIYALGLASVVLGALPQVGVPTGVHDWLVGIGGVIIAVERYLQGTIAAVKAAKL